MAVEVPMILYVDDEPINLRVFDANFKDRFKILTARYGDEGLDLLAARHPEIGVLVSDHRMPGMTGVEFLEKARGLYPDIQRFLITAYSDMTAVLDAVNRGQVSRYFVKPWNKDELLAALEEAMRIFTLHLKLRDMDSRILQSERLATIGQVSAGIAHELMNPVGYVTQNVQALRRDLATITDFTKAALAASPNAKVQEILNDLPSLLADVEEGTQHIRKIALNIRSQARGQDDETEAELSEVASLATKFAGAELRGRARLTTQGEKLKVKASPVKVCQVLLNLIVNAAHATEKSGRQGLVQVRWADAGETVKITVEDNGTGIPPEIMERIFEPLFTTKPAGVGTGLGLPICKSLVKEMNGELWLESKVGEGTQVHFSLPRL